MVLKQSVHHNISSAACPNTNGEQILKMRLPEALRHFLRGRTHSWSLYSYFRDMRLWPESAMLHQRKPNHATAAFGPRGHFTPLEESPYNSR